MLIFFFIFLIIAFFIGIFLAVILAPFIWGGAKAKIKKVREEADLIISKRKEVNSETINKLIDDLQKMNQLISKTIPEEDMVRIQKLREIRDN